MTWLDWLLVAAYFVFSFGIALYFYRRAGRDTTEFFLSGRNMPWWLAGTSMVATTFAADTPLAVTERGAQNGIAGNWLWWNMALGGMLTVFFFALLWRRAGVMTDVEFVELRYHGKAAAWLRGIKALYFGLVMNAIILGWVSLAMETVIRVLFPDLTLFGQSSFSFLGIQFSAALALVGLLMLVVAVYSLLSGLWGVAVTDVFQFGIAMLGTILLAFFALDLEAVGGSLPESDLSYLALVHSAEMAGSLGPGWMKRVLAGYGVARLIDLPPPALEHLVGVEGQVGGVVAQEALGVDGRRQGRDVAGLEGHEVPVAGREVDEALEVEVARHGRLGDTGERFLTAFVAEMDIARIGSAGERAGIGGEHEEVTVHGIEVVRGGLAEGGDNAGTEFDAGEVGDASHGQPFASSMRTSAWHGVPALHQHARL